jgi:hypothetical protein
MVVIGRGDIPGVLPLPVVIGLVTMVAGYFLHTCTCLGRHAQAVGSNPEAAELAAVPVPVRIALFNPSADVSDYRAQAYPEVTFIHNDNTAMATREMRRQVVADQLPRRPARVDRAGSAVRLQQQVLGGGKRGFRFGAPSNTSSATPARRPPSGASRSAVSSTQAARPMLIRVPPGPSTASTRVSTMCRVSGVAARATNR